MNAISFRDLAAIIEHAYYIHLEQKRYIPLKEAIKDFEEKHREQYEIAKIKQDKKEQAEEVEKYKYIHSQEAGHDIGKDIAHCEWTANHAASWRKYKESPGKQGFICLQLEITSPSGLHYRPATSIALIAKKHYCNMFIGHKRLTEGDINIEGKNYLDITSLVNDDEEGILGASSKLMDLTAIKGDNIDAIFSGKEKEEALSATKYELSKEYDKQLSCDMK
jgi:phosphotransferase system HPr-like phosphotransfer protein